MRAEHIPLERSEAGAFQTVRIHVPLPSEGPVPALVVREVDLAARPAPSLPSLLSAILSKLIVFRQKYRWYRGQGYGRAEARAKARWHARAAPCPFAAP